ncbi:hypothetical protein KIL84_000359 [Mauremys mutica]|uniref:Uncharacterized protein n=1 Tax=Mauremys mutica TaxID=74926 RepID=A0A9D3XFP4_9SAUR|nr:hypothetical protein KIL84_000359 [Mauremys mutica]
MDQGLEPAPSSSTPTPTLIVLPGEDAVQCGVCVCVRGVSTADVKWLGQPLVECNGKGDPAALEARLPAPPALSYSIPGPDPAHSLNSMDLILLSLTHSPLSGAPLISVESQQVRTELELLAPNPGLSAGSHVPSTNKDSSAVS